MFLEKSIIGVDIAVGHDQSCIRVRWNNDGSYTKDCVDAPIVDRRTEGKGTVCVGTITSVDNKYVRGIVWGRYIIKDLFSNLGTTVSMELGKEKE